MSTGFQVRPAELATASLAARRAAEHLRTSAAGAPAPELLPACLTTVALRDCAAAWQQALALIAAELDGVADRLHSTATGYRETDAEIRHGFLPAARPGG
ncbi:hypothetical protein [Kitasatospora sp. McL0602]|uniref:hypothetical protein n=1 Tax=Kitasatospora sp. McL0602 TaxID=3439530 RepID=UPI003F8AAE5C